MHALKATFNSALILFTLSFSVAFCSENLSEVQTRKQITALLEKWAEDFNNKNVAKVCELYAPDLVVSYPEIDDRNYEAICKNFSEIFKSNDENFYYEKPLIQQILITGDLAVVRLLWTLKITYKDSSETDIISEKGMDIFQRQKDGNWKIIISYAYPEIS